MQVDYEKATLRGDTAVVTLPVEWWLGENLSSGGIEMKVEKLRKLLVVIGEQWLTANPQMISAVAYAIECDGRDHKLTTEPAKEPK